MSATAPVRPAGSSYTLDELREHVSEQEARYGVSTDELRRRYHEGEELPEELSSYDRHVWLSYAAELDAAARAQPEPERQSTERPCKRCGGDADVHRGRWQQTCATCRPILVAEAKAAGAFVGGNTRGRRSLSPDPEQPGDEQAAREPDAQEEPTSAASEADSRYAPGWLSEEKVRGTAERVAAAVAGAGVSASCAVAGIAETAAVGAQVTAARPEEERQEEADAHEPSRRERPGPRIPSMHEAIEDLPALADTVEKRARQLQEAQEKVDVATRALETAARAYLGGLDQCRNALLLQLRAAKRGRSVDTSA